MNVKDWKRRRREEEKNRFLTFESESGFFIVGIAVVVAEKGFIYVEKREIEEDEIQFPWDHVYLIGKLWAYLYPRRALHTHRYMTSIPTAKKLSLKLSVGIWLFSCSDYLALEILHVMKLYLFIYFYLLHLHSF
jgi:hypothetical protein